jgi:hypothetical protein
MQQHKIKSLCPGPFLFTIRVRAGSCNSTPEQGWQGCTEAQTCAPCPAPQGEIYAPRPAPLCTPGLTRVIAPGSPRKRLTFAQGTTRLPVWHLRGQSDPQYHRLVISVIWPGGDQAAGPRAWSARPGSITTALASGSPRPKCLSKQLLLRAPGRRRSK